MLPFGLARPLLSRATRALVQPRNALALRLHTHPNPLMARKSARAVAAAEASHSSSDEHATSNKTSLSDLTPKACLTCGRVITPRAKWAKDWAGIKYCSDRCRSTRPGKVVVTFKHDAGDAGDLEACSGVSGGEGEELRVDVETFVEGVVLDVAGRKGGGTLEDAQDRIEELLKRASIPIGSARQVSKDEDGSDKGTDQSDKEQVPTVHSTTPPHPLWKALDHPPGVRERLRRAARRLALSITHDSSPHQTLNTTTDSSPLLLSQSGKPLRTVQDLSFAKGDIHIQLNKS